MSNTQAEHLTILPALVRCAMVDPTAATTHQVKRLADALDADGETTLASQIREIAATSDDGVVLQAMIDAAEEGSVRRHRLEQALEAYRGPKLRRSRAGRGSAVVLRKIEKLPPVQGKVLKHLSRGASDIQIAVELNRSINTVRNHVKLLLRRFDVRSRAELIAQTAVFNAP